MKVQSIQKAYKIKCPNCGKNAVIIYTADEKASAIKCACNVCPISGGAHRELDKYEVIEKIK